MFGTSNNNWNCRIGKVTLKTAAGLQVINGYEGTGSPVRHLFHGVIREIDNVADAHGEESSPRAGFYGLVWDNGAVDINWANKNVADGEAPYLNWRHLVMVMEDFTRDLRRYTVYEQPTPIQE